MIDWHLRVLGLLAATLALAAPAAASGAVTIGSNLEAGAFSSIRCPNEPCTLRQSDLPTSATASGGLVSPIDGVVVRWRIKVGPSSGPVALRVIRFSVFPRGSTGVGTGPTEYPAPNQISTYDVRLPISGGNEVIPGDQVGIDCCGSADVTAGFNFFNALGTGALLAGWTPVLVDNAQARTPNISNNDFKLLINADIEPDCDADGFGDQTQDPDLSSCGPSTGGGTGGGTGQGTGPAPTLPSGAPATCKGVPATMLGTEGDDVRTASQGPDVIVGLGGNDTLSGLGGNDLVCGGPGKDTLKGGPLNDSLLGQKGKDKLKGGGGNDLCKGGKGKDTASKCEAEKSI